MKICNSSDLIMTIEGNSLVTLEHLIETLAVHRVPTHHHSCDFQRIKEILMKGKKARHRWCNAEELRDSKRFFLDTHI